MNYQSYLFNPIQSISKSQAVDLQNQSMTQVPMTQNNQQLSIQVINLKSKVQSLQVENNKLNDELSQLKIAYSNLQNEQKQQQLENDTVQKQSDETLAELQQTKEHLKTALSKLANAEKLKVDLLRQLDEITAKNVDISVKLNDLQENFDEKLQQACQKLIVEAQQQQQQFQSQIQYLNEEVENKSDQLSKALADLKELQDAQVNYEKLIESAAAMQQDDFVIDWKPILDSITNIVKTCNEQDLEIRRLHLKSNDLQTVLQMLKVDYEALQNERGIGMKETQQALAQVQASRAVRLGNSIASQ